MTIKSLLSFKQDILPTTPQDWRGEYVLLIHHYAICGGLVTHTSHWWIVLSSKHLFVCPSRKAFSLLQRQHGLRGLLIAIFFFFLI